MVIGTKIKALCKERGTSVRAVELATGLGNGVIMKWDKSDPGALKLKRVADYFGVTVDFFLA